jgi:uncharacterized protein (DUF3820 family)
MMEERDYPEYQPGKNYQASGVSPENLLSDSQALLELANAKMPFGKYAGGYLVDLPENYVLWFKQKGFPEGKLGKQMAAVCEIKVNGLEPLLRPLRGRQG